MNIFVVHVQPCCTPKNIFAITYQVHGDDKEEEEEEEEEIYNNIQPRMIPETQPMVCGTFLPCRSDIRPTARLDNAFVKPKDTKNAVR